MKINNSQKKQVSDYLRANGIHHEDVYFEMFDHMLTGIENQMTENSNLNFEQAFSQSKENFGPNGFQEILNAKKNTLEMQWKNMTFSFLKQSLSPLRVLGMLVVFLISWYLLHQLSDEGFKSWYMNGLVLIILEVISYIYISNNSELETYKDRLISVSTFFKVLKNTYWAAISLFVACYFLLTIIDFPRIILEAYLAFLFVSILFFSSRYRKNYEQEVSREVRKSYPNFSWN